MDCTYKAVRADKMSIYGKHDKRGLVVAKTLHHYIIGTYESNMYASVAVEAVEKLGKHLPNHRLKLRQRNTLEKKINDPNGIY